MASRTDSETRGLTGEALSRLLAGLDEDRERAGEAYEALRRVLVKFFDWRCAIQPEECADETLDRLARKLDEGAAIDDPARFARGIARLVLLERWRRPDARALRADPSLLEHLPAPAPAEPLDEGPRSGCFERCLDTLPDDGRRLILGYYAGSGRVKIEARKRLAESLRVTESALRNRAQRIRDRLERCTSRCLEHAQRGGPTRNGVGDHS